MEPHVPQYPAIGHDVSAQEYLLIYGPLAVIAVALLALLIGLWRAYRDADKEHDEQIAEVRRAADARVAEAHAEMARQRAEFLQAAAAIEARHVDALREMTADANDLTKQVSAELQAQRAVMEAAFRRLGGGRRSD